MKTILVPVDYSETSNNALNYAMELAELSKSKIVLFHAYQVPLPTGDIPVMLVSPAELEKDNVHRIKKLEKKIQNKLSAHVQLEHECRSGFISDEIVSVANEKKADLIVMGIKGETKINRALIGSNTVSVIKHTKTPVLVIPEGCTYKKPGKIVLAYDYRGVVAKPVLENLKRFVNIFKAKLLVLDVVQPEAVPVMENAVAGITLENSLHGVEHSLYFPEADDVTSEINSFVDTYKADWLVMMPHRYKLFENIFHKSNVRQMAFHTHVPLLSLHD